MKPVIFNAALAAAALILFTSCSAADQPLMKSFTGERIIPDSANKIFIRPFSNSSGRVFPLGEMRIKLKELIGEEQRLAVVDAEEDCDIMLGGEITAFSIHDILFSRSGTAEKRRIRLTLSLNLIKCRDKTVIFRNRKVEAHRTFSETTPPIEDENRAVLNLIDTAGKRITSLLVTGWYTDRMTPAERGK